MEISSIGSGAGLVKPSNNQIGLKLLDTSGLSVRSISTQDTSEQSAAEVKGMSDNPNPLKVDLIA